MREQGAHSRKKEHHVGDLEAEQSLELREVQGPLSTSMSPNNQHELNPPGGPPQTIKTQETWLLLSVWAWSWEEMS